VASARPDKDPKADLPRTAVSDALDTVVVRIGSAVAWIWLALVAVIMLNVALRDFLNTGLSAFEEIQWRSYAVGFLVGLTCAVVHNDHVRIPSRCTASSSA